MTPPGFLTCARARCAWVVALVTLGACDQVAASLLKRRPEVPVVPAVDPCPSPTVVVRSLTPINSASPRITAAGARLVVAHSELRAGAWQAVARPVDPASLAVSPPLQLSQGGGTVPAVTWDGQHLVAVWLQVTTQFGEGPILLGRFDDAGALVGSTLELTPIGRLPDVVWNGAVHAVTWQDSTLVWQGFAGLVNGDGTLLSAGQNVCNWGDCLSTPRAAWNGETWGVAWLNDGLSQSGSGGYDVGFRLVSAAGALLTEPLAVTTTGGVYTASIASDGDAFLLAIVVSAGGATTLLTSRVDRTATLVDTTEVASHAVAGGGPFGPPDLLWDNGRYVMAWAEGPAGATRLVLSWLTPMGQEFGARVPVATLPAVPADVGGPAIAVRGGDYFLTWWQSSGGVKEIKIARVSCGAG